MLIYKATLWNIPVKIIYTFDDDNRLRSAGYIVDKPVAGVKHLREYALDLHGAPTNQSSADGMGWLTQRSMIYFQLSERVVSLSTYIASGGPLSHLEDAAREPTVVYWDGVWGYVDTTFIDKLTSVKQLNHYEKLLLGVMRARKEFIIGDDRYQETPEIR